MAKITSETILNFKTFLIEEKSKNTVDKYIRDITFFITWLCNRDVTKMLVLNYKTQLCQKYAPSSVNAAISSLNSFFVFMNWHNMHIKTLKIQRQIFSNKNKELTKTEYIRLLSAVKKKHSQVIQF